MPSVKQGSYYDSTRGMNPRSTDYEVDALTTTPSRRLALVLPMNDTLTNLLVLVGGNSKQDFGRSQANNNRIAISPNFCEHVRVVTLTLERREKNCT